MSLGVMVGYTSPMPTMRSGSGTGKGRNSTAWTTVKMAALAPRQMASVRMTVALKPGFLTSSRTLA